MSAEALDGDLHPCACPDCGMPLAMRLWLERADCWSCGASVVLAPGVEGRGELPAVHLPVDVPSGGISRSLEPEMAAWKGGPALPGAPVAVPPRGDEPRAELGPRRRRRRTQAPLKGLPAWLSSLLFHLALLIILALLTMRRPFQPAPTITLAPELGRVPTQGDRESLLTIDDIRFDLPIPEGDLPRTRRDRQALLRANQDALALRLDPQALDPQLPDLERLKSLSRSDDVHRRALVMRDPRLRVQVIRKEGGTTLTEAAVARGLQWLAAQQDADGSWPLSGRRHRLAGTSLALLPFLGAGQTHLTGIYRSHVSGGLRFLLKQQQPDGDLRGDSPEPFGMYVHGQATIVLCEAFAMTQDERLREPAQRGLDFIVEAQHPRGGWRYQPHDEGDTSVLGWQLMALQSGRAAGLHVPQETLDLADQFLEMVQSDEGAFYAYQPGHPPTHVMTAEGLLCRMYLGWKREEPGLVRGARALVDEYPPQGEAPDYYYWYYATQTLHHLGGPLWERWNRQMRQVLVDLQWTQGRHAGSWDPRGPHAATGGRIYVTSLAICSLEIYYRHAPIFRQIDLR